MKNRYNAHFNQGAESIKLNKFARSFCTHR